MEENKRKTIILTFIGALTLLFVVVGGTFAYFQIVNTGEGETKSTLTGETEGLTKYGTPTLTQGTNKLHINLKASDMAVSKSGTEYWATNVEEKDYETGKQQHIISTAGISGAESEDTELTCTSELTIKASGSILEDTNSLVEEDGYVYLGVTSETSGNKGKINPAKIDIKQIVDKSMGEGVGYQTEISYTIKGNTSIDITVDIDIINRDANQNSLAGKTINFTITNKNISCSVKEPRGKAYMKKLTTMVYGVESEYESSIFSHWNYSLFDGINYSLIKISFVDYLPSNIDLSNAEEGVDYIDLTDTELSPEKSVIGWLEDGSLYIGSESEIYAKDLSMAFREAIYLKTIDFSNLNTSETTDMSYMFDDYRGTSLDLSTFDTSQVTDMSYMFRSYEGTSLDLSTFDTSKVTNMSWMFSSTSTNITFPQGFGSSTSDMSYMFRSYEGTSLDLSTFDTSKVTNMSWMFIDCSSLITLDLSSFDTSKVLDMSHMFSGASTNITFPQSFGFSATNMSSMFSGYGGEKLDLSNFDTSSTTDMSSMFSSTSTNITFPQGFGSSTTNMSYMFSNYEGTSLDLSTFDTSKVTNMSWMFIDCSSLITLDLSTFTFDNITGNGKWGDGNFATFSSIPSSCQVTIKKSQQETFESKFSYDFTPTYVD